MDKSGWQNLINVFKDRVGLFGSWLDSLDQQTKNFHLFMMMGFLVLGVSLVGCQFRLSHDIDQYEKTNLQLAQTIIKRQQDLQNFQLQEKLFKETKTKLSLLQSLQNKTLGVPALLLELADVIPVHAQITRLVQHGDNLNLEGKAGSNSDVSELLQNLAGHSMFYDPVLISLKQSITKSEQFEDFEVAVKWRFPAIEVAG